MLRPTLILSVSLLAGLLLGPAACRPYMPPPPSVDAGTGGAGKGGSGGTGGISGNPDGGPNPGPDGGMETGPACGEPNQACCPGNRCLNGGCCERGMCTSYGDVCKLATDSSCVGGTCSNTCGGVVNGVSMKCCSSHNCTMALTVCDSAAAGAGLCVGCGKPGLPCCTDNSGVANYCEGGLTCTAGKCPGTAPPPDAGAPDASKG
jgi:hypothetical protein